MPWQRPASQPGTPWRGPEPAPEALRAARHVRSHSEAGVFPPTASLPAQADGAAERASAVSDDECTVAVRCPCSC